MVLAQGYRFSLFAGDFYAKIMCAGTKKCVDVSEFTNYRTHASARRKKETQNYYRERAKQMTR
jgi:hypothetical protein